METEEKATFETHCSRCGHIGHVELTAAYVDQAPRDKTTGEGWLKGKSRFEVSERSDELKSAVRQQ